jgi:hypothetical protein
MDRRWPEGELPSREHFLKIEGHASLHLVDRVMKHDRESFVKPRATMTEPASYPKHAAKKLGRAAKRFEVEGSCVCRDVVIALDFPAFWAWHDHSSATRRAHGAAYATYVGAWKSRVRVLKGEAKLSRFEDAETRTARSFCTRCGTPIFYQRLDALKWINMPRALFSLRTGREPRYHIGLAEAAEWEYRGEPLAPLKGFPGVMWARPRPKKLVQPNDML